MVKNIRLLSLFALSVLSLTAVHTLNAQTSPPPKSPIIIHFDGDDDDDSDGPTPAQLEGVYHRAYFAIANTFHDVSKLKSFSEWQKKFDGKLKTEDDMDKAIKAMVASLNDPYTNYASPTEMIKERTLYKNGVRDSGVIVRANVAGNKRVDYLEYGSPAYNSVLRRGDVITSITSADDTVDDSALAKMSSEQVQELMRGKIGGSVKIGCKRGDKTITAELPFIEVADAEPEAKILTGDILYASLPHVQDETVAAFVEQMDKVIRSATKPIRGIILDLRGDSGGEEELEDGVVGLFLESGKMTASVSRSARTVRTTSVQIIPLLPYMTANDEAADRMEEDVLFHKPLIVLADDATASAAEAVVQALKENKRGRFVGVRTYGKAVGYYQKALPNGGVLQVTGLDMVNGWANGIEPDVLVEQPRGESTVDVQLQAGIQALEKLIGAAAAPAAKH